MEFGEFMDLAREETKAIITRHQDGINELAETMTDELFPNAPKSGIEREVMHKVALWMAANEYKPVPKEVEYEIMRNILG